MIAFEKHPTRRTAEPVVVTTPEQTAQPGKHSMKAREGASTILPVAPKGAQPRELVGHRMKEHIDPETVAIG